MITLAIPTLRRYDLLARAVQSACCASHPPQRVLILDNGVGMPKRTRTALIDAAQRCNARIEVQQPGHNLGVAASWNLFLRACDDDLIIANDDVTFYHNTIQLLVTAAAANPDGLFFFPGAGGYKNAWSLFLQRKRSIDVVGLYDETLAPGYGYYEDNDYSRRLLLAGYKHLPVANCGYGHVESATLQHLSGDALAEHWQRFRESQARYVAKWGGLPGAETFTEPHNGTTGRANAHPDEVVV